jgi:hypothetical protein
MHHVVRDALKGTHLQREMLILDPVKIPGVCGAIFADVCIASAYGKLRVRIRRTVFESDETFAARVAEQLAQIIH